MTETRYTTHDVPVDGGALRVGEWRSGDLPVLAIHGVSSTHRLWAWMAAELDGVRIIAPDLRGRGASQEVERVYGLARHRDDMIAVLDHLGIERCAVVGMSLGGYIAVALAAAAPERVESLVLVDGGFPFMHAAAMATLSREQLAASFRDRLGRLEHPWASLDEYRSYFLSTTAPLVDAEDPLLTSMLEYDLIGAPPELTVRLDPDAIAGDTADVFLSTQATTNLDALRVTPRMLYAEWSVGRDTPPGYTADYLARWTATLPGFEPVLLPGTDHAATIMSASSGRAIARQLEAAMVAGV